VTDQSGRAARGDGFPALPPVHRETRTGRPGHDHAPASGIPLGRTGGWPRHGLGAWALLTHRTL